jgi:hypothetical protein
MKLVHFLIRPGLTRLKVSQSPLVSSGCWSVVFFFFSILGNLFRGVLFVCCNQFLSVWAVNAFSASHILRGSHCAPPSEVTSFNYTVKSTCVTVHAMKTFTGRRGILNLGTRWK